MPYIRPTSELRNRFNDISRLCHEISEPVFITRNGVGDLAVMSLEVYEALECRLRELEGSLLERTRPTSEGGRDPSRSSTTPIKRAEPGAKLTGWQLAHRISHFG